MGYQRALCKATRAQRGFAEEDDVICAEKLVAEGVEIIELDDDRRRAFVDATKNEVTKTRAQFDARLISLFDEDLAGG